MRPNFCLLAQTTNRDHWQRIFQRILLLWRYIFALFEITQLCGRTHRVTRCRRILAFLLLPLTHNTEIRSIRKAIE